MLEALSTFNEVGRGHKFKWAQWGLMNSQQITRKRWNNSHPNWPQAAHAKLSVGESKFLSGASGGQRAKGVELQLLSSTNSALFNEWSYNATSRYATKSFKAN